MLRSSTTSILQRRRTPNNTILRSRRSIPQYSDVVADPGNGNVNGYQEESRYGDFAVLNENNHPGVIYYFIEVTNQDGTPLNSSVGNNNNNNNNNNGNSTPNSSNNSRLNSRHNSRGSSVSPQF